MPKVNPAILEWARETAGLNEEEAVAKLGLNTARGVSAVERLHALESGAEAPSRTMLGKMAKQYRRPLVVFYMSEPPLAGNRGQDFRTLPHDAPVEEEAHLNALIRDLQARQSLVKSALVDEEEGEPLAFIGSLNRTAGVDAAVNSMRSVLGISLEEYRSAQSVDKAFSFLRERVEGIGVFVLLIGDLGSHHTVISLDTFRGLSLSDPVAPFIVINDRDHHAAWSFTLLHELCHLFLGQTGVSGRDAVQPIERFCNDVASEFLLPGDELEEMWDARGAGVEDIEGRVAEFAASRVRNRRTGCALVSVTARLMASGALTSTKAGIILRVKPKRVERMVCRARSQVVLAGASRSV